MFGYEIWCEGNCLGESDGYEYEEEAESDAREAVKDKLNDWGDSSYSEADFEIIIIEN